MKRKKIRKASKAALGVLAGMTSISQAQLIDGQAIGIDFGPTAPTNNFNQRDDTGTSSSLIDLTGAAVSNVTVTLSSASGNPFSNNDADDTVGSPPAVYDSSNLTDWVGLGGNNGGLIITIANLDDSLLYDLNIGHAFSNNAFTNGTTYRVDDQSAVNVDASADPNFFDLNALATDGSGNLVITVTLPWVEGGDPEVPTVAALTLTANGMNMDSDGDGLNDAFETRNSGLGYDPNVDDSLSDFDDDGSTVEDELANGTSVLLGDTDGDGFFDGAETNDGTFDSYDYITNRGDTGSDPLDSDTDDDTLEDGVESGTEMFVDATNTGSDPNFADSDLDGLDDDFEVANNAAGYDPNVDDSLTDFDDDASTVEDEIANGTDVLLSDTDGDGFWDGAETNTPPFTFVSYDFVTNRGDTGTDPLLPDSDGDNLLDGDEPAFGADPNLADTDDDGVTDDLEVQYGTDPNDDQDFPDLPTVLAPSADGTYFEVSETDIRVNNDVIRVGGNNGGTIEFVGLMIFDLDGVEVSELQSETLTLNFDLGRQDNAPVLDDLVIDYVGTFASDILGVNGVNGADPNATTLATASVVTNVFSGAPEVGPRSVDVTAIGSDSFTERYAVFRFTDPTVAGHQWDITDLSSANQNRLAATLMIGTFPETSELVLCIEEDPAIAGNLLLSWNGESGATYDVRSSTDLSSDPSTWTIVMPDVAADVSGTTTESIVRPSDAKTFYVVTEQ